MMKIVSSSMTQNKTSKSTTEKSRLSMTKKRNNDKTKCPSHSDLLSIAKVL
jgi:hypothetical protein